MLVDKINSVYWGSNSSCPYEGRYTIDISKLKKDLMIENFFVKKDSFYEESVYLDEILTNRYDKWLTKLLNHIEKDNNTIINLTKIERLIIQHREEVIYDSDEWELIEYININEKIA